MSMSSSEEELEEVLDYCLTPPKKLCGPRRTLDTNPVSIDRNDPSADSLPRTSVDPPVAVPDMNTILKEVAVTNQQLPEDNLAMKNMLMKIYKTIEKMYDNQRIHGKMLQALMHNQHPNLDVPSMPDDVSFPLTTRKDLIDLKDCTFQSTLTSVLKDLGGRNVEEFSKRIMRFLFSNKLALCCSLSGRNGKLPIGNSHLFDVIFNAMKKNSMTASVTKKETEICVAKWLLGSRDRDGNRVKRLHPNIQSPQV